MLRRQKARTGYYRKPLWKWNSISKSRVLNLLTSRCTTGTGSARGLAAIARSARCVLRRQKARTGYYRKPLWKWNSISKPWALNLLTSRCTTATGSARSLAAIARSARCVVRRQKARTGYYRKTLWKWNSISKSRVLNLLTSRCTTGTGSARSLAAIARSARCVVRRQKARTGYYLKPLWKWNSISKPWALNLLTSRCTTGTGSARDLAAIARSARFVVRRQKARTGYYRKTLWKWNSISKSRVLNLLTSRCTTGTGSARSLAAIARSARCVVRRQKARTGYYRKPLWKWNSISKPWALNLLTSRCTTGTGSARDLAAIARSARCVVRRQKARTGYYRKPLWKWNSISKPRALNLNYLRLGVQRIQGPRGALRQ